MKHLKKLTAKTKNLALALMAMTLICSCSSDDSGTTPTVEAPEILNFDPKTGPVGTEITIDGKNFSATASENTVKIGTATATVSSATATKLVVSVPAGATTEKLSVTVNGKTATAGTFTVTETEHVNLAPVFGEGSLVFEQPEDISDVEVIGTVSANDPDGNGENLIFEITTNTENNLFEINEFGDITLAEGMHLDYEGELGTELTIEVTVSDGTDSATATVTITILDVLEPGDMAMSPDSFITTWDIPEDGFELVLGVYTFEYEYDFTIDWGDGTIETIVLAINNGQPTHVYATADEYTIAIQGKFPAYVMSNLVPATTLSALISMDQWGTIVWQHLSYAFHGTTNLKYNATDIPNLSQVTSLEAMFVSVDFSLDAAETIGEWDVSNITDLSSMFQESSFNGDISGWEVGLVEDMSDMFSMDQAFNQDLSAWDISNVTDMSGMFDNSWISPTNFSNTVISWSNQEVQQQVALGAAGVFACASNEFEAATFELISNNQWEITYNDVVFCT